MSPDWHTDSRGGEERNDGEGGRIHFGELEEKGLADEESNTVEVENDTRAQGRDQAAQ